MDGANVITGKNSGLITRTGIENQRNWFVKIHCINHKAENAAKKFFQILINITVTMITY